jgi:hypothetical protein
LEKIKNLEKSSPTYKESFDALRTKVAVAASKMSSPVFAVSEKGKGELTALGLEIDKLKDTLKDATANYVAVDKKRKTLEKQIEELKAYDPQTYTILNHKITKDLPADLHKLLPEAAMAKLDKFETDELAPAKKKANVLKQELLDFQVEVKTRKNELKAAKLDKSSPALYQSLEKRLTAAAGTSADRLTVGYNELNTIKLLIQTASDPAKAEKLNTAEEEEEFADKRRKAEFEAARELFDTTTKKEAATLAKETRTDEYKQMLSFENHAKKMAALSPPDFAGARDNLQRATEMANFLIANSEDYTSPLGRNLKKLNALWKNKVSVYLQEVSDLENVLESAQPPANAGAIDQTKVKKAVDPLLSFFDPVVFDKYVTVLAKSPKSDDDLEKHRALKEQALLRVRRFQKKLTENKVLKHIGTNTISPVILKPLRDTLSGMEAQLLGS